ncbi:MAG TPA: Hsp20/alpha crystallin family protein, partial [Thermodesulfobacteriota bacterium]|nr:Hsp20/alpha crystallin family protein [Thermodesulfobacteriota bacterium]
PARAIPARSGPRVRSMRERETLLFYWIAGAEGPAGGLEWGAARPAADVVECGEALLITLELAGAERETLTVSLAGRRLEVRGVRRPPEEELGGPKRYLRREIVYGPFERALLLPEDVDEQSLEAEYRDGLLRIRLRRRPAAPEVVYRIEIR